ncbi:MAG: hypothetical protein ACRC6X_00105 [Culicoidibacterales bacterium]
MGILDRLKELFKYEFTPTNLNNVKQGEVWLGEYEKALLEAIDIAPEEKKAKLWIHYAEYLSILIRHEESEKAHKAGVALGSSAAKFAYAFFLDFHYLYEESEKLFLELIEQDYERFHIYNILGNEKFLEHKYEKALVYFLKGEKLGNKVSKANSIKCLAYLGEHKKAEEKLKEGLLDSEIPKYSLWSAYRVIIREFYSSPASKIYEAMLYDYKECPWTQEKEDEYRYLIGESLKGYQDALKIEKSEITKSCYNGELFRNNHIEYDMKRIKEINEQWYSLGKETIFEGDDLENKEFRASEMASPDKSYYEMYWDFHGKENPRYRSEAKDY